MMDKDLMKKALMARKGKGIDLTIILGKPEVEVEKENEDLAPGQPESEEEMPEGLSPEEMMASMSEYDKSSLMDREPKGLGERARKELLMKMGK